jgi:acyl-CoA thioester hydrolase
LLTVHSQSIASQIRNPPQALAGCVFVCRSGSEYHGDCGRPHFVIAHSFAKISGVHTPTPFKFSNTFKVRWVETDLQHVVFFGHYLTYCDEALMEYLSLLGFSFDQFWARGLDWVYAESHLQYKGSAQFNDSIRVHVRIAHIGNSSVKAEFQIFKQGADEVITTGEVVFIVVDKATRKPTRVPDDFRQAAANYQAG